ncbi:MAG: FAD/NAD(P)-binding protein [Acidimicrobiia bacterium]|nr:FAD/NAD(P)-binding protein [Acidimicrobiia bacterium]
MVPVPTTIVDRWDETDDTFSLSLAPPPGYGFEPGQFNMLYAFGVGEVAISVSGDPASHGRLVHTVRGVGSVTKRLRDLVPGDVIGVRGPFGNAWPVTAAEGGDLVVVAGGIGLAPLRPAILHALAHRDRYDRVVLLYGTRTPRDLLYADLLSEWRGRFDMEVLVTVDNASQEWRGSVGVVTKLIGRAPFDPKAATVLVCGPEVMMRFCGRELRRRGVPTDRIWLSMERNMQCAIGVCGHCQFGPVFVCRDGPVFRYDDLEDLLEIREV